MKILYLIIMALFFGSCYQQPSNRMKLDYGPFTVKTPMGWRKVSGESIDSYHGGLTNGIDSVWFDYGRYGVAVQELGKEYLIASDTVNGLQAEILKSKIQGDVFMVIPKVTETNMFTIWCHSTKEMDTILSIYKSIVFKTSDTSINPPLTDSKFGILRQSGKELYKMNCSSCHSIRKEILGPPLEEITNQRTNLWIYTYLAKRDKIKKDSLYFALRAKYKISCINFPDFKLEDIDAIVDYIKQTQGYY